VESEGLLSESYLPGAVTLAGLTAEELLAAAAIGRPARPGIAAREGALLARRLSKTARLA
jgi:hypothetical protein